jgi:hypothetical protein
MILPSAELRWFCRGQAPLEIVAWFDREQADIENRTDSYVLLNGTDVVGVKVREGKLEVKALTRATCQVRLPYNVMGQLEHWIKWSIDLDGGAFYSSVRNSAPVIDVVKARRLVKFASSRNGLHRVPAERHIANGCNVELTELGAFARNWWTFGFEAFGETDLDHTLLSTTHLVLTQAELGAVLHSAICQSYPSWIAAVSRSA